MKMYATLCAVVDGSPTEAIRQGFLFGVFWPKFRNGPSALPMVVWALARRDSAIYGAHIKICLAEPKIWLLESIVLTSEPII